MRSLEENSGGRTEKEHVRSRGEQGGFNHRKEQRRFYVFSTERLLLIEAQRTCCHQLGPSEVLPSVHIGLLKADGCVGRGCRPIFLGPWSASAVRQAAIFSLLPDQ